jgi:hypothetical protein
MQGSPRRSVPRRIHDKKSNVKETASRIACYKQRAKTGPSGRREGAAMSAQGHNDPAPMTPGEIAWLDACHAGLPAKLGHLLDEGERTWLAAACRPLA